MRVRRGSDADPMRMRLGSGGGPVAVAAPWRMASRDRFIGFILFYSIVCMRTFFLHALSLCVSEDILSMFFVFTFTKGEKMWHVKAEGGQFKQAGQGNDQ